MGYNIVVITSSLQEALKQKGYYSILITFTYVFRIEVKNSKLLTPLSRKVAHLKDGNTKMRLSGPMEGIGQESNENVIKELIKYNPSVVALESI